MRWKVSAGLLIIFALGGCKLAGPPNSQGLHQGKYRVRFDITAGASVPSVAVGHHDFTFAVVEPTTVKQSFTLVSATLNSTSSYLNAQFNETIPQSSDWTVSWRLAANFELRVSVVLKEESDGQFSVPSGCHVLSDEGADYVGSNCSVVRAD